MKIFNGTTIYSTGVGINIQSTGYPLSASTSSFASSLDASTLGEETKDDFAPYDKSLRIRSYDIWKVGTGTAITFVGGGTAPTVNGTATNVDDVDGGFVQFASTTGINNAAGFFGNAAATQVFRRVHQPDFMMRIKTPTDLTNIRLMLGLWSADPTADSPATHGMGFRYSTVADGTAFWRAYSNNGGTAMITTTTVPIASSSAYWLRVCATGTDYINYYINDSLVATHTGILPTGNTNLATTIRATTLVQGTAKNVRFGKFHIETLK